MSQFDDRQRGQEKKFELDQELEFKAQARRAKLVGLWAAGHMGLTGEAADDYAKSVVLADLEEKGEEDLYRKIAADLRLQGATGVTEHQIRTKMAEALDAARAQVRG